MTWEAVAAIASLITAVIIAVTAIAALIQIRHLRSANQLTATLALYGEIESPELRKARSFCATQLAERLKDPQFRDELLTGKIDRDMHLEMLLGNYWAKLGLLMRRGLIDRDLFLDYFTNACLTSWRQLHDVLVLIREASAGDPVWRDFEYIAGLAEAHLNKMQKAPLVIQRPPPSG